MNLNELIPKHKTDLESVRKVISVGYPTIAPILPELLIWIQDINWPVAKELAPFLATIGEPLEIELRKILKSDDGMWKYWIIVEIIKKSPVLLNKLENDLVQITKYPTEDEKYCEVDLIAQEALQIQ